ncbi:exonuclease V [Naematelia encephala]|uniref:Exonuclease V n=1 Tax=Naematelia encephala TaxID=71784 RepID=A0A1Y2AM50_9TREE|nr:exonuclease V [Naematelia encephala]
MQIDSGTGTEEDDDDFGPELKIDDELANVLATAESHIEEIELEDVVGIGIVSPFEEFRKKGFLSVSDLVGTVWCEVQYDYRLRTLPYLPAAQRPEKITSTKGVEIKVDKIKVEDKEKVLKRGQKIHKRLEREIHPEEIIVRAVSREDVWGLRFLNMLSALEALLTLGKCRELPVVGFVKGILVMGIIDEITREPIMDKTKPCTRSDTLSTQQTQLTSFFRPSPTKKHTTPPKISNRTHKLYISDSKTRASGVLPRDTDTLAGRLQVMLYKELLDAMLIAPTSSSISTSTSTSTTSTFNTSTSTTSTSTTSTSTFESSTANVLPSRSGFSWSSLFAHLELDASEPFSEHFVVQSRPIILGNGLRHGASESRTLNDMINVWTAYVDSLGLGSPLTQITKKGKGKETETVDMNSGKTEDKLELVYRRAGPIKGVKVKKKNNDESQVSKGRRKRRRDKQEQEDEDELSMQLAIQESLRAASASGQASEEMMDMSRQGQSRSDGAEQKSQVDNQDQDQDQEDDELAWAVEMSLATDTLPLNDTEDGQVVLRASQPHTQSSTSTLTRLSTPPSSSTPTPRPPPAASTPSPRSPTSSSPAPRTSSSHSSLHPNPPSSSSSSSSSPSYLPHAAPSPSHPPPQHAASSSSPSYPPSPATAPRSRISKRTTIELAESKKSGSIIGKTVFTHSPRLLHTHLESVLQWWLGHRSAIGVTLDETRRCGWCEFEENCEWRAQKALEVSEMARRTRLDKTQESR